MDSTGYQVILERVSLNGTEIEDKIKGFDSLPFNLEKPSSFKNYINSVSTKTMTFKMTNITISEKLDNDETICFNFTMIYKLNFFGMKFAKHEYDSEPERCNFMPGGTAFKEFKFKKQSIVVYSLQTLFGLYFLISGLNVFLNVVSLLKNIMLWILGLSSAQINFEIDFNTYRLLISNKEIIEKLSEDKIENFHPVKLSIRFLRPLYFALMIGYLIQIIAGVTNIYCLIFEHEVSQTQLSLSGFAVFFAWLDLYTLTSLSKSTGILSSSLVSVFKHVFCYLTIQVGLLYSWCACYTFCICVLWALSLFKNSSIWILEQDNLDNLRIYKRRCN